MKRVCYIILIFIIISTNIYAKSYRIVAILYGKPFLASLEGLESGLKKLGYHKNLKIYTYNINTDLKKIPDILKNAYKLKADLIFATTTPVNLALKKYLKKDIPVIFNEVADPVGCGLVKSLSKPECNFTGVSHVAMELLAKRLEIFKEMFPEIKEVILFINPLTEFLNTQLKYLREPAKILNIKLFPFYITQRKQLEKIINNVKIHYPYQALFMGPDAFAMANVDLLIKYSHRCKVPLMVIDNVILSKGGCVGYSPDFYSVGFQSAFIADKIFKGASPENIPVEYPEKINLVINLKEIKRLNLKFNKNFLIYADKVIK